VSGVNKVFLLGRLGHDPSLKNNVCSLSIATSEAWKDKNTGEKQERTEWHRAVAFGKTGENIDKYFAKGDMIFVEGKLQTRKWEGKDGTEKQSTEIIVSSFQFCGDKKVKPQDDASGEMDDTTPF
jgi:single-strand DNA-binding protein